MANFKRPALPLKGGCACGAVRYEISAMPFLLYACHCTECQRRSGSAFALNMPVATESFRIVKGTAKSWRNIGGSGATTTSWFCGDCGGRIHGERDDWPGAMSIRAGTLDDTSWLRPLAHFYMRSAQPWETIAGEANCFETGAKDVLPLVAAWQAMWTDE
jgi:hypothetical protein